MKKNKDLFTRNYGLPREIQDLCLHFVEKIDSLAPAIHTEKRTDDSAARDQVLTIYNDAVRSASLLEKYFNERAKYWANKQLELSKAADSYRRESAS